MVVAVNVVAAVVEGFGNILVGLGETGSGVGGTRLSLLASCDPAAMCSITAMRLAMMVV